MRAFDIFFWVVVIVPVFAFLFTKIAYPLGMVAAIFDDFFEIFTYVGVKCSLVATLSNFFALFLLGSIVIYIYSKIKV